MALLNKLNRMARTFGELANDALEASRDARERQAREANRGACRIDTERAAAEEQFRIIGEYYYNIYAGGGLVDEAVLDACEIAKTHMDAIVAAEEEERIRMEEERIRREEELAAQQAGNTCPECGAEIAQGKRFCGECGTRIEAAPPKARFCGACGTEVEAGMRFCGECGCRMEE